MWDEGTVLDQGSEGACVGFAWTNELLASPAQPEEQPDAALGNAVAVSYYRRARVVDEWPGEDYEGTSVLAGAKMVLQDGFISQYRWCFNTEDLRDAIISEGPVVIGIPWYSGMYRTRRDGLVVVDGDLVGGHAILITGYDPAMIIDGRPYEVFRWRNSWGTGYGIGGSGYILYEDLSKLLKQNGEACVPMGRKTPIIKEHVPTRKSNNILKLLCKILCK